MRFLVTAGNTREPIDSVRMWSNIFTGNTGRRIAEALADLGSVDLLTSSAEHLRELPNAEGRMPGEKGIGAIPFHSYADLRETLRNLLAANHYDAIIMTAAVADYTPAGAFEITERVELGDGTQRWIVSPVQRAKIRSTHEQIALLGTRTEKIVDLFRQSWGYRGLLVKFKLEVGLTPDELIAIGQQSRRASGADYLVANSLEMVSGANAGAFLLSEQGSEWVARDALPRRLASLVAGAGGGHGDGTAK